MKPKPEKFAIKFAVGTTPDEVRRVINRLVQEYGYTEKDTLWNKQQLNSLHFIAYNFYLVHRGTIDGLQVFNHACQIEPTSLKELFPELVMEESFYLNGSPELEDYFTKNNAIRLSGNVSNFYYYIKNGKWTVSSVPPSGRTLVSFPYFYLYILKNQTILNQTTMQTTTAPQKQLSITKTDTVTFGKKKREITITVLLESKKVRSGYSVRNPEDKKSNPELARQISTGRAQSDKTNLTPEMYVGIGTDKKFILYAIAEQLFRELNSGKIQIKGVK